MEPIRYVAVHTGFESLIVSRVVKPEVGWIGYVIHDVIYPIDARPNMDINQLSAEMMKCRAAMQEAGFDNWGYTLWDASRIGDLKSALESLGFCKVNGVYPRGFIKDHHGILVMHADCESE
jgi:hypothetical protein